MRGNTPLIKFGKIPKNKAIEVCQFGNPIKQALHYRELIDQGQFVSQQDLADILGVARSNISHFLALSRLDEEARSYILQLDDGDVRLKLLNERRLRRPTRIKDKAVQRQEFWELVGDKAINIC